MILELFSILSRLINVLTGGGADMTFSARSHIEGLWTERVIDWVAWNVFGEVDHCRVWWEVEVMRSHGVTSLWQARQEVEVKD